MVSIHALGKKRRNRRKLREILRKKVFKREEMAKSE